MNGIPARTESSPTEGSRMGRILVVEDNPVQALQLQAILTSKSYEVEVATDADSALTALQGPPIDLVISDVLMPNMSGFDLCAKIKANAATRHLPVILLTSLNEPADILEGLECGADNFITKPYEAAYLLHRVGSMLESRNLRRAGKLRIGAEVMFLGKRLTINSDKEQILDLLVGTFEDVVRTNRELRKREAELAEAKSQLQRYARELEGQVRVSEGKYRRLMEQAQDAIFILDSNGRVQEANRSAENLLGEPASAVVGCSCERWVLENGLESYQAYFKRLLTDGVARLENARLVRADGRQLSVDCSAAVVDMDGSSIILTIVHDVTERNRLQEQYRQAQKMQAIGQLAGGVAHDFNNLLTVISGYGSILMNNAALDDSTREMLGEIQMAGDRAASLTRQLLAFSRKQVIALKVVDVNIVVCDIERMLRRLIGEDIKLTTALEPSLWPVTADGSQLEQVIMNLVINARDAMPHGGQLLIETANSELDASFAQSHAEVQPGPYVMLAVSDTGCGMDEETKTRIFEPFFTTKAPGKGTGLGLATVYGLVKQFKGHVWVYSEPDRGTTFKIFLPRSAEHRPTETAPNSDAAPETGWETILVTEDEDAVRSVICHVLGASGFKVLQAANGRDAIDVCERHQGPIHLLITDVVMPEIGGRQLAESVRTRHPDIKVLYVSGYTDDAVVRHGILAGETPFLEKPFTFNGLSAKVRQVLRA